MTLSLFEVGSCFWVRKCGRVLFDPFYGHFYFAVFFLMHFFVVGFSFF